MLASQGLRRTIELAILAALASQDDYANQIARRLRDAGLPEVTSKQVYATVGRLLHTGAVTAHAKLMPSGQTLQHYRLTPEGHERLDDLRAEWRRFADTMSRLIG